MELKPENLHLTADVEELARKALLLPEEQRSLFHLVEVLRVGVFKARVIKAVETAGRAVHAPLPALDLGAYAPEFRGGSPATARSHASASGAPGSAATLAEDEIPFPPSSSHQGAGSRWTRPPPPAAGPARCLGCGGIASVLHECGAPLCQQCIVQFHSCPKCGQPVTMANSTPLEHAPQNRPAAKERRRSSINPFRALSGRARAEEKAAGEKSERHPSSAPRAEHEGRGTSHPAPTGSGHDATKHAEAPAPLAAKNPPNRPPPATPSPEKPRPKTDDEPRL